jgi:putative PEP-CTERM system histidine kinase
MSPDFSFIIEPLSYLVSAMTLLLALVIAIKDSRSFANRCFIAGLILLGMTEITGGLSAAAVTTEGTLQWQTVYLALLSITPGTILLFSLSFARQEYGKYLSKWKFIIIAVFLFPLAIILFPFPLFKHIQPDYDYIELGYAGKVFYTFILLISVLILANLERTLRASIGRIRWQIKFIILGTAVVCADWIYSASQAILYTAIDTSLSIVHPAALLCANLLFIWGLMRSRFLKVDVYLSRSTIQYSLTTLFVSLYLVILGLLAYRARFFDPENPLPILSLLILLALAGLGMLLLSDRLQEKLRRFVTRHFKRPLYDYRKAWMELTEKTSALISAEDLCTEVAKIISKTFGILSVNIWLCDEDKEQLSLVGSTVFTRNQTFDLERKGESVSALLGTIENRIADLKEKNFAWVDDIMASEPEYFDEFRMRYIVPLQSGGLLVGIITLNDDRVGKAPLSIEDRDLLHAYSAQLAARLLQLRLSENLRKVQEIEAFQNVTAFFVHDLKNLASRLSLTMQNLPTYFENPEFRDDALKLIGESVAKIESTCSRLSSLKQKIELKPVRVDFNELVTAASGDFERATRFHLDKKLGQLPPVYLDPEQIQKVLTNLVMNAYDAAGDNGKISIATSARNHQAIFTITDNGCGMSRRFINKMLFRPFQSTKKKGMGIGLFQSRMIVEAHHGKIEVESEEGEGSTFRVILPVGGNQ